MKAAMIGLAVGVILAAGSASADDWPAFRGPTGNGLSSEKAAPTAWAADKNVKWKVALPQKCNGSPIVSKGKVFVTCAEDKEGKKRSLYCFDRKDGKQLWAKTVELAKDDPTHPTNLYCGTTPAADGDRVIVWESSAGLHCFDYEGKNLWSRDLGEFHHIWGYGTSPVIHNGKVYLNSGPGKRIFVTALDPKTGKTVWETEEPIKYEKDNYSQNEAGKYQGSWCTPMIVTVEGKEQLICTMPTRVVAYGPEDGKILWWCDGLRPGPGDLAYSSPVIAGDVLVAIGGFNGAGFAVRMGGGGDVTASNQLWRKPKYPQSIGSGVCIDGHIYVPFEGFIDCIEPKTGKAAWHERAGTNWGSIVSAGGNLYVTDQKGVTWVFKANPEKFELVSKNALGEESNSTPAVSDGQIFIRTHKHLYCIAE